MSTTFETWFSSDWQKMLREMPDDRTVFSNGQTIQTASWDRRAAYLLWVERGRPEAEWQTKMSPLYRQNPNEPSRLLDRVDMFGNDAKPNTSAEPVNKSAIPMHVADDDLLGLLGDTASTATVDTDDELEGLLG